MLLLRFIHDENKLYVGNLDDKDEKIYKATCKVRNELNLRREKNQVVKTYPLGNFPRKPYMPRKFPTGRWRVKKPIWTDDIDYAPVKIPTQAFRDVATWEVDKNGYVKPDGKHQTDAYYHLHFCKPWSTTLGCIRLDSDKDAREIAEQIEYEMNQDQECWIEVIASRE